MAATLCRQPMPVELPAAIPLRVRLRRQTAILSRWLHLYLSMVSFAVVLFFAVTGLTLNHPDWFAGQVRTTRFTGTIPHAWLHPANGGELDKLAIVERLRADHHITGAVSDLRVEDSQVSVSFKGPGYAADAGVDRDRDTYDLLETRNGVVAVLNDLHKGRDTGAGWSWVIDASAVLLTLVSLSGLVLLLFVYKRRTSGFVLAGAGGLVCWLVWLRFVP